MIILINFHPSTDVPFLIEGLRSFGSNISLEELQNETFQLKSFVLLDSARIEFIILCNTEAKQVKLDLSATEEPKNQFIIATMFNSCLASNKHLSMEVDSHLKLQLQKHFKSRSEKMTSFWVQKDQSSNFFGGAEVLSQKKDLLFYKFMVKDDNQNKIQEELLYTELKSEHFNNSKKVSNGNYPFIHFYRIVFKISGWLAILGIVLTILFGEKIYGSREFTGFFQVLVIIRYVGASLLSFFFAELLKLLTDIKEKLDS
jgi:hypothetical protein